MLRSAYNNAMVLPGALLSGLSVYAILTILVVPNRITIPAAVIISIVVFGLTYLIVSDNKKRQYEELAINPPHQSIKDEGNKHVLSSGQIIFLTVYIMQLVIVAFVSKADTQLFDSWEHFNFMQTIDLVAAISLCFFLPGFAIVSIIDSRKHQLKPTLVILLAYFFSLFLTGLIGYISGLMAYTGIEMKTLFVGLNLGLLTIFISLNLRKRIKINRSPHTVPQDRNRKWIPIIINNKIELAVFASLVSLIILSTFILYHGTIIGDQWFHHGRALLFLAGAFTSVVDFPYPFFFHSLLASFFSISGVPTVNAYVSINILNVMTIVAFYYFFKEWISNSSWKRGALLACTLFMLGSGFGWVNVIGLIGSTSYPISQHSALEILNTADLNTGYDILRRSSTFITTSPEPTGPLGLLALPAGFLLLGLIKENISSKFKYIAILTSISIIGILSHDEFYLFIIVGSIAPVIFRLPQRKNSVYIALILSILLVFAADLVYPVKYYTSTAVFGVPLLALALLFVSLMWVLYLCRTFKWIGYLHAIRRIKTVPAIRLSLGILIVGVFCYFYVLSFIVWGELSLEKIEIQQHDNHIPWYLYVIKLGVPGLFGLAFVLSYLFKKYEKEVFIFGILAVVALLAGPYYNEYRLSKYVMAGVAGFAALLVYRINIFIPSLSHRPLLGGLLMGLVVTSSSLSLFLFLGFTALALQNPNFSEFHESLERRIFPSPQDIHFLSFLHNNLISLKTDNVTVSGNWEGVNSKLEGFVGTSLASLPQFRRSPFTLSSSVLEDFYNLLNYSNSRYIIWAKNESIDLNAQQVVHFALENFKKVYEDNNYIVVAAPSFAPPTPPEKAVVAIVNQQDGLLLSSLVSNQKLLPYNNQSFKITGNKFIKASENENETDGVTILGDQKRITLWSKPIQQRDSVNYIEAKFRILDENITRNNVGVVWEDQKKQYYVSLSDKGLQLSEKMNSSDTGKESLLLQNSEIIKEKGKLYTLKIVIFKDSIKIYLDEFPRLQIKKAPFENTYISKIGLRAFRNVASFEPVKIGQISDVGEKNYQRENYYHDYYPLSALALSNASYDIFLEDDLSALSKNKVIIPRDPVGEDWLISRYLQYVNGGGTLIVINTENNFDGEFSKKMSIKGDNESYFNSISNPVTGQTLNVSGFVSTVKSDIPNANVKSFYFYNKQRVAPFIIEKSYGDNGGKIVFVNGAGYFDAILNSPPNYFSTLANMLSFIDLNVEKYHKESPTPTKDLVGARFFDNLKISGNATINSTSLLLPDQSYILHASDISVLDHRNNSEHKYESIQTQFKGSQIKNLTLNGPYEVIVTSRGLLELPSASAQYNYIGIPILRGSDMRLKLSPGADAEFVIENDTGDSTRSVKITGKEIQFHGISLQPSSPNIEDRPSNISSILFKSPKIEVNGSTTFEQFYNPYQAFDKERQLQIDGNLTMRLNQIDDINDMDQNTTKTRFVTYLDLVKIQGNTNMITQKAMFRIPGDISSEAKEKGFYVPLLIAMSSVTSIIVVILILLTATLSILLLWPKMKSQLQ